MSKTLQDLINNLKRIEEGLPEVMRQSTEIMAHDSKSLAERKIKDEGFGSGYSTRKSLLAFGLYEKAINARGHTYLQMLEIAGEEYTNWGEFRKAQGLQTNHVDLSYTGRMWMGMRPDQVQIQGDKYFAVMGHNDNEGKEKMNANFEHYGDFIGKALQGEEDFLSEIATENILKLLDEIL